LLFHSQFSAREELLTHQPPELFDISVVPLSALNTVLPQGNTMPEQRDEPIDKQKSPPQPVQEQPKESPPKTKTVKPKLEAKVASPNAEPEKLSPENPRHQDSSSDLGATAFSQSSSNAAAVIGVPGGDPASTERARLNYQEAVAALLARSKRYPERALRRGMSGDATIRIEVRSDGSVSNVAILKSTQFDILDEELHAMVERAAPFPSFPRDLDRTSLALVVPVAFTIKGSS
jgi:protein TonB